MSLNGPSSPLFLCGGARIGGLDAEDPTPHGLAQVGVKRLIYSSSSKAREGRVGHWGSVIKGAGAGNPGAETCGSGKMYFGPPFAIHCTFAKFSEYRPLTFLAPPSQLSHREGNQFTE
ncbi:hypothetical protein CEXT_1591 [Caerostris extrusa]|uniref:Uncharacterized protein n=1 Tax=Caerostris extrusa TaxID=172846 RepID=A0AAV4TFB0_CAEEX|nr:hypothetical protein CEXT_1591 [Caerostris extrusa]